MRCLTIRVKCFYLFIFLIKSSCSVNMNPLVLIISFDGFRFDYFERNLTDSIVNLRNKGSYSPYMMSVFPTKTFPNHFSIATGLYVEVHGVLDNIVYDQLTNKTLTYGYDLFHYNDDVVPIWTLNEMAGGGRRSGCMMFPGCNFKYHDTMPSHYSSYNESVKYEDRVDTVLSWFNDPDKPINLGMLYFEQPDLICHSYGPNSEEINKQISHANQVVEYLLKKSEEAKLLNRLNIILLSDHGGQAVKVPENLINLDDFVNRSLYVSSGVPPNLQIFPIKGKEAEVLAALRAARNKPGGNFTTFTREEIPEQWHFKRCTRAPPVYISADVGFLFQTRVNQTFPGPELGTHGYAPEVPTMRGIFMAVGPAFKRNHTIEPFQNIHIYPMLAHLLGLTLPALKPNGSFSYLQEILVSDNISTANPDEGIKTIYIVAGVGVLLVCVVAVAGCFLLSTVLRRYQQNSRARKEPAASYRSQYSTFPETPLPQGTEPRD